MSKPASSILKAAAQPVPIPYGTAIDCYDAQGKLLPDEVAAFDGRISGCANGETPKPKSERSRVPKDVLASVEAIEACQKREANKHYKDDSVARQNFQACSKTNAQ